MKINLEKTQQRLSTTAPEDRVYIYDASLILEFLRESFINPKAFVDVNRIDATTNEVTKEAFHDSENFKALGLSKAELYELYIKWRLKKTYTTRLEKMWKFFLILRRMRFYKNGWQFGSYRQGSAQIVYFTPFKKHADGTFEEKILSNPLLKPADNSVEVTQSDMNQD